MKKINYYLLLLSILSLFFCVFTLSLSSCSSSKDEAIEIDVANATTYVINANGEVKIPFEFYPSDAKISAIAIKCRSYTKRTNDPASSTTLKTLTPRLTSVAMDAISPSGRVATVVILNADGTRFTPNAQYTYYFNFKSCYLYVDKYVSPSFGMEYSYGE